MNDLSTPTLGNEVSEVSGPLAEMVFESLLDAIYQGRLAPGSVINEVALAQEFNVSRGPVREAVRRLQGVQLVTREPYMKARVVTLSAESVLELFQMRMALEGVACNLATRRMGDQEIADLLVELERDRRCQIETRDAKREFDFHERIVRASGNQRIIHGLCGDLYHLQQMYRHHSGGMFERKDDAYAEHWQILRAMHARDAELAESLIRSHIERAGRNLFEHLTEQGFGMAGSANPAA